MQSGLDSVKRSTAHSTGWLLCLMLAAWMGGFASAQPVSIGGSLGMIFPSDRLSDRSDFLGSFLLPAPSLGFHVRWSGGGDEAAWEGTVELAIFQSDDDPRLRTMYIPVQVGRAWEVADVGGVGLNTRLAGGMAFATTNLGERRSLTLGIVTLGAQLVRSIRNTRFMLDFEAGLHIGGAFVRGYRAEVGAQPSSIARPRDILPVYKLRLTVFTR